MIQGYLEHMIFLKRLCYIINFKSMAIRNENLRLSWILLLLGNQAKNIQLKSIIYIKHNRSKLKYFLWCTFKYLEKNLGEINRHIKLL